MSGEWIGAVVAAAVLLWVAAWAYLTAHRLDRLHIRADLARAALAGLLERRHSVASAVAETLERAGEAGLASDIRRAVAAARAHPPAAVFGSDTRALPPRRASPRGTAATRPGALDRPGEEAGAELAETTLGRLLAAVQAGSLPPVLAAESVDVAARLDMARRFYNDAVRDTRTIRERPAVRLLRLAGHAPMPGYVEIATGSPVSPG